MKKPSVTELLKLLDKPALMNWANKQGLKGIDISKERNVWLNAGTSIHKQIEMYVLHKTPFENISDQLNCDKFLSKYEVLDIEKKIETDYFYGRLDAKVKCKESGNIYLVDFKNKCSNIYFEHKLQLVAYSMAEDCDGLMIIGVPEFLELKLELKDIKPFEEIIISLSNIFKHKQLT